MTPAVAAHVGAAFAAAQQDPSSIDAVGPLCLAYHADMLFDQAERCYDLAIELEPNAWTLALPSRAARLRARGQPRLSPAACVEWSSCRPDSAPAWLRLGDAEFKAGRYDAAADAWGRARDLPAGPAASGCPDASRGGAAARVCVAGAGAHRAGQGRCRRSRRPSCSRSSPRSRGSAPRCGCWRTAFAPRAVPLRPTPPSARAGRLPPFAPYADPGRRRAGSRVAERHAAPAAGLGGRPGGQPRMERAPDAPGARVRARQPRSDRQDGAPAPRRRAQRGGAGAVRALSPHRARRLPGACADRHDPQRARALPGSRGLFRAGAARRGRRGHPLQHRPDAGPDRPAGGGDRRLRACARARSDS